VPIGYYRNRFPNPYTGNRGDATFPKYIVLASYGYRFGGANRPNTSLAASSSPVANPAALTAGSAFKPFKLKTLDGTEKALTDVLGKATLVVFFYPTCPYCNQAAPDIQKIYDTYKSQGLSVVWINILPEEQKLVADWQARHGYTAPVLAGANLKSMQRDYDVDATPTHYLLDSQGKVLTRHTGFKAGDAQALEQEIKRALEVQAGSR
jgi:peroxiredoxin